MTFGRNIGVEFVEDLFKKLNVALTVTNHRCHGTTIFLEDDVLPKLNSPVIHLTSEAEELADVVQLVGVEHELALGELAGIKTGDVVGKRDAVLGTASANPPDVEEVSVVGYNFIRNPHHLDKCLKHLFVVVVTVPPKRMDCFFAFPFVTNADNCSLNHNVLMGDVKIMSCAPEESDVGTRFNIKEQTLSLYLVFH